MGRSTSSSSNNNSSCNISPHPFRHEPSSFIAAEAESEAVVAAEQAEDKEACNEQQLRVLLNELSFWESDCSMSSLPQDHNHAGEMEQQQHETTAVAAVDSPTLRELEAANTWQKAVDPASGRIYYYDSITRQSQWEKPREIRAIEKRMKKEQRQQQIVFFREMERTLLASLARGEVVPGRRELEQVGPPQEPLYNRGDDATKPRVRTISAVNEHLLAQLSLQEGHSKASHAPSQLHPHKLHHPQTPSSPIQGRPPLPSRPPQPQFKPSNVSAFSSNASSSSSSKNNNNNISSNDCINNTNGNGIPMPSFHSSDSLELSPDAAEPKSAVAAADSDTLRGVDLLDHAEWPSSPEAEHRTAATSMSSSSTNNDRATMPRPAALHVRSHTAGGAVHDSMEQPDIDATINCVCSVFRAHMETALQQSTSTQQQQHTAPPHTARINFDVFWDDYEYRQQQQHGRFRSSNSNTKKSAVMPSVATIRAFYKEFYQRSQMEHDTIIMSLIYVERLMKMTHGALQPTPENWGSVLISCMILASKVWDDLSMWNIDFSNLSVSSGLLKPFSLSRINELELAVLTCLNFAVAIPASEYAKYYYLLRNMMIRGGLLALGSQQHQVLSKDEANRLENKTSHYQDSKLPQPRRRQARSVDWSLLSSSSATTDGDGGNNSSGGSGGVVLKEAVCLEHQLAVPMEGR